MSSSERLPSFKGPRDLSLSARGAKRDAAASAQSRPRRIFTPNIPPKRDRGGTSDSNSPSTSSSVTTSKDNANAPGRGRGGQRGRGGPRGGGRPPKQRGELLQAESIFSDGVGDPMDAKRNSAMQYRSGYGSRYKSATDGGGGPSRMSSMNRTTLNTLIKEENDESNRKIFGSERFEQEEECEDSSQNPNTPVVLPLIGYVSELFMDPTTLEETPPTKLIKSEDQSTPGTSKDLATPSLSLVKIKEEKIDEDEVPGSTIVQIKQEKLDETETDKDMGIGRAALASMSLDPISFPGTLRSTPQDGTIVYFQFPDELPVLHGSIQESVDQPEPSKNSADLIQDISDLPEGFIGKLQILSSGRTRFILGENAFDVDSGRPVGFRQELLSVDTENNILTNFGPVNRKFVLTPDIECLIRDAL